MKQRIKLFVLHYGDSIAIGLLLMRGLPISAIKSSWMLAVGKGALYSQLVSAALFAACCTMIIIIRAWFSNAAMSASAVCAGGLCSVEILTLYPVIPSLSCIFAHTVQCLSVTLAALSYDAVKVKRAQYIASLSFYLLPFLIISFIPRSAAVIESASAAGLTGCALSRAAEGSRPLSAKGMLAGMLLCALLRAACTP